MSRVVSRAKVRNQRLAKTAPCPMCGNDLDVSVMNQPGFIGATVRCPGCDCSIGLPALEVVYIPEDYP